MYDDDDLFISWQDLCDLRRAIAQFRFSRGWLLPPGRAVEIRARLSILRRNCLAGWHSLESMPDDECGSELRARRAENLRRFARVLGMDPDRLPELARRWYRASGETNCPPPLHDGILDPDREPSAQA